MDFTGLKSYFKESCAFKAFSKIKVFFVAPRICQQRCRDF